MLEFKVTHVDKRGPCLQGSTAFVPQQAWIQNMSLRNNILFERPYIESKYQKILTACRLQEDLRILVGGDQIEIGERVRFNGEGKTECVSKWCVMDQNSGLWNSLDKRLLPSKEPHMYFDYVKW